MSPVRLSETMDVALERQELLGVYKISDTAVMISQPDEIWQNHSSWLNSDQQSEVTNA